MLTRPGMEFGASEQRSEKPLKHALVGGRHARSFYFFDE
ncbi:hypothetical protein NIES2104_10450 [Leptolyngbya sp. NIES-2104]|nr:hypothetical protein NIES2104_10450 [Leptolyngbya sp. NIES-2104]